MAQGITPARGPWETRSFPKSQITTLAQGAFSKGDLVTIDHGRNISVFTSTQSGYLGIALNDSSVSQWGVCVAIPMPGCTAYIDSLTTDATSNFSLGQAGSIITRYGRTSCASMLPAGGASAFSFHFVVANALVSAESRVEVTFLQQGQVLYSASSGTWNN